ncbi:MAG: glycosyltransferase family 39 protein, partial [Gemmatimonadota bacterium]|nr:glycosyltransferase family 39 protein [Gemmatimonadota bacterium]
YFRIPTFGERFHRRTVSLVLALVSITAVVQALYLPGQWETARGHEYEQVATSLADGHGFSFPPGARWLVLDDEPGADKHGATAWKEPFYPYFMAASFKLFGERYGRLAIVLAQLGFLILTCTLIYRLGSSLFGPGVGIAAALLTILLLDLHYIYTIGMATSAISGLLMVGGLLLLLRYGERPSLRRALWLGFYLGLAALTHAVLVVLVPITGLFMLLHSGEQPWRKALKPALLMGLVAALTISPWTVRNYVQFGHLIPVQTGFGLFANMSNSFVAETYVAGVDACGDGSPPVYRSDGPVSALRALREDGVASPTHRRAVACIAANHAEAYPDLNEHERDGLHKEQFLGFVAAYPGEFLSLTATKSVFYIFDVPVQGRGSLPLGVAAVLGMLLVVRKPRMWVFPLAILAYAAPFALTSPVFYRYQAPIEPLYALFTVVAVVTIFGGPARRLQGYWVSKTRARMTS